MVELLFAFNQNSTFNCFAQSLKRKRRIQKATEIREQGKTLFRFEPARQNRMKAMKIPF